MINTPLSVLKPDGSRLPSPRPEHDAGFPVPLRDSQVNLSPFSGC